LTSAELFELFTSELQRAANSAKLAIMLAGPNGAGKSTAFETLISKIAVDQKLEFLNADDMVRELVDAHHGQGTPLSALEPAALSVLQKQAQKQMHTERSLRIEAANSNFVFETVFSDPDGHRLAELDKAQQSGLQTVMVAVCSDDLEALIERVRQRALRGAHGVDEATQRSRYPRVRANLCTAASRVSLAILLDNSRPSEKQGMGRYRALAFINQGQLVGCVPDMPAWAREVVTSVAQQTGRPH